MQVEQLCGYVAAPKELEVVRELAGRDGPALVQCHTSGSMGRPAVHGALYLRRERDQFFEPRDRFGSAIADLLPRRPETLIATLRLRVRLGQAADDGVQCPLVGRTGQVLFDQVP